MIRKYKSSIFKLTGLWRAMDNTKDIVVTAKGKKKH